MSMFSRPLPVSVCIKALATASGLPLLIAFRTSAPVLAWFNVARVASVKPKLPPKPKAEVKPLTIAEPQSPLLAALMALPAAKYGIRAGFAIAIMDAADLSAPSLKLTQSLF
jgi:hypothetical protein